MKNIREYKIFISSPSDVMEEREIIAKVINSYPDDNGIRLTPVSWDKDMPATSGQKPQKVINQELLNDCDILVGVFCSKFGTPTEEYDSGTVEEIETFIKLNRKVILYFINKAILTTDINPDELIRINQFKEKYKELGIYKNITKNEVEESLRKDLKYNLRLLQEKDDRILEDKENNDIQNSYKNHDQKTIDLQNYGNWWSDESITDYINEYLKIKNFDKRYEAHLTFYENVQRLKGRGVFTESTIINILHQAKAYAFNKKYGNYSYDLDIRSISATWASKILHKILEYKSLTNNEDIIGIGANNGSELKIIFKDYQDLRLTVLDISKDAITVGKKAYPDIKFVESDMESDYPIGNKFDICLCLRTIQSRGVFRQDAIMHMDNYLKNGGLIILSIPNGYIDKKKQIYRGLYDHRSKTVQERRPQALANKVLNKLIDYGYKDTGIETLDTEILIWGVKNND